MSKKSLIPAFISTVLPSSSKVNFVHFVRLNNKPIISFEVVAKEFANVGYKLNKQRNNHHHR